MKRLYELSQTSKDVITEDFVNEAYELIRCDDSGLDDYILDFKIDEEINGLGEYNPDTRIIRANPILMQANIDHPGYNKRLQVIHTLKKEIELARNLKRLYEGDHDIESLIVRLSQIDYIKRNGLPSDFSSPNGEVVNSKYNPGERLANIRASKYVINLIKNQRRTQELLKARCMLYYSYIKGYEDNGAYLDAPTYTFLMNLGMYDELRMLKNRVDSFKYCLNTRATLGLPIKYSEKEGVLALRSGL